MGSSNGKQIALLRARMVLNKIGLRKKKVFAIGFNKCATTSLHSLFSSLGLPSHHGVEWRGCDNLNLLNKYDCFSDGIPKDLAKLDTLFPGSKFILQVRDLESWVYSRLAHIERSKARGPYETDPEWDNTEQAINFWIQQRNDYHLFVLSYFAQRPSDLIVVNFIKDPLAGTKVANFLGYAGNYQRPKENVKPDKRVPPNHIKMLKRCAEELRIPSEEMKCDIYCPSLADNHAAEKYPADTGLLTATEIEFASNRSTIA